MDVERALSHLSEIHAQVLRSEVFRGYRAVPMAGTGLLAIAAAAGQEALWPPDTGAGFCWYWFGIAGIALAIQGIGLLFATWREGADTLRRRTLPVVLQFVPTIVVGAALTAVFVERSPGAAAFLPGLWAVVFSLGVFASRPYLPRAIGWVGAFYLLAGIQLLLSAVPGSLPSPWTMGVPFGIGQIAFAAVLHVQLERRNDVP